MNGVEKNNRVKAIAAQVTRLEYRISSTSSEIEKNEAEQELAVLRLAWNSLQHVRVENVQE